MAGTKEVEKKKLSIMRYLLLEFDMEVPGKRVDKKMPRKKVEKAQDELPSDIPQLIEVSMGGSFEIEAKGKKRGICDMEPFDDLKARDVWERNKTMVRAKIVGFDEILARDKKKADNSSQASTESTVLTSDFSNSFDSSGESAIDHQEGGNKQDAFCPITMKEMDEEPDLSSASSYTSDEKKEVLRRLQENSSPEEYAAVEECIMDHQPDEDESLLSSEDESDFDEAQFIVAPKPMMQPETKKKVVQHRMSRRTLKRLSLPQPDLFPLPSPITAVNLCFSSVDEDSDLLEDHVRDPKRIATKKLAHKSTHTL
jgi:hypothetical protein